MVIYDSMKWSILSQPNQEHNLATVFYLNGVRRVLVRLMLIIIGEVVRGCDNIKNLDWCQFY